MKSPQVIFDELCTFVFDKLRVLNFSKKGRAKFVRKCATGTACINICKSYTTTKDKIRFTIELKIFVDALDWITRNPENYWEKNNPDTQFRLHKFSPDNSQANDWWDISNEIDGQYFSDQISTDFLGNIAKHLDIYESMDSVSALWLSYANHKQASTMTKIKYVGLLYALDKKIEGEIFLKNLFQNTEDPHDRRLVVKYIEKFSKKFY